MHRLPPHASTPLPPLVHSRRAHICPTTFADLRNKPSACAAKPADPSRSGLFTPAEPRFAREPSLPFPPSPPVPPAPLKSLLLLPTLCSPLHLSLLSLFHSLPASPYIRSSLALNSRAISPSLDVFCSALLAHTAHTFNLAFPVSPLLFPFRLPFPFPASPGYPESTAYTQDSH
jgi:hypothetical protein